MVELIMEYEWAIVLLGVIAYCFWELYALRRDKRRRGSGSDSGK
jgi:hypothetical protein